ncbi:MAG: cytochrome c-type biogenesis protein [Alphaproteobacteria bacterium]
MKSLWILLLTSLSLLAEPALAVQPDEMLDDPALEARAREISKGLRCVVCQNENIDSSNAPLARDLRLLVRERLKAGDSNEEVIDFVVARYGDFVLLRPPVQPSTWFLWFGPALFVLAGGTLAFLFFRTQRESAPAPRPALSDEEKRRVEELVGGAGGKGENA